MNLELEKIKLEKLKVETAKHEMQFKIYERTADIERLQILITKQEEKISELQKKIEQLTKD